MIRGNVEDMDQEDDIMEGLQDRLQGMGVRSENARARMMTRTAANLAFYPPGSQGKGLEKTSKNLNNVLHFISADLGQDEQEECEDSTYEDKTSSGLETEEYTEGCSMEQEEGFDDYIPAEEVVLLRAEAADFDDGASDYCASDNGEGPDDEATLSAMPKSKDAAIAKYTKRAQMMLMAPSMGGPYNLTPSTQYWICRLARFSFTENRWVDKGPVMIYFINVPGEPKRLIGNFLYGTRSVCMDLQLYENMDCYWRHLQGNRLQFSSFGHNAIIHADIVTEKVSAVCDSSHSIPLYECKSVISSRQEPSSTCFTLKFLSHENLNSFGNVIQPLLSVGKQEALQARAQTFLSPFPVSGRFGATHNIESTYRQAIPFVEQMVLNGIKFAPTHGKSNEIIETVQCSWCGVTMGPFQDIVDIVAVHRHHHQQAGPSVISCPFTR